MGFKYLYSNLVDLTLNLLTSPTNNHNYWKWKGKNTSIACKDKLKYRTWTKKQIITQLRNEKFETLCEVLNKGSNKDRYYKYSNKAVKKLIESAIHKSTQSFV